MLRTLLLWLSVYGQSSCRSEWEEVPMTSFDRVCAALAFVLGAALAVLGVLGIFFGCSAHFTLPPIFGVIPALVGWGIIRTGRIAWRVTTPGEIHRWKPSRSGSPTKDPSGGG